jgi:hypothetical protein
MTESTKKEDTIILIDDVEYDTKTFTEQQILLLNHCIDLDRKLASTQFQLQQIQVGKDAFLDMLKRDLAAPKDAPANSTTTITE